MAHYEFFFRKFQIGKETSYFSPTKIFLEKKIRLKGGLYDDISFWYSWIQNLALLEAILHCLLRFTQLKFVSITGSI